MPYHIGKKGSHDCKGFPVVKDSDSKVMGCHKTKEDAKKQLAALYANEPEASKEKTSMAMDYATSYAEIVKYDKNDDGTLMVFGKATDDTLDLDSQICDPKWLDAAMPQWFKSGGNIREMHGPSAAGVAKEYEAKNDGHYIGVHVVDPIAAKKVETGVYQGFSIGIKSPRVIRDVKAANGRIVDGQIIEVSLVDRPANPSAKLILAKSVEGESSLVQVEEVVEKYNENHDERGQFSSGDGGGSSGGRYTQEGSSGRQYSGRDNRAMRDHRDEAKDLKDRALDLSSELSNSGDNEGADDTNTAINSLSDAADALNVASNTGDRDEHINAVSEARDNLLDAHTYLKGVDHGDADDLQDEIGEIVSSLEDYVAEIVGVITISSDLDDTKSANTLKGSKMKKIERITQLAKSLTTTDIAKFDKSLFDNARRALAELIASEALEMHEGHDERASLTNLIGAVNSLMAWYEGESFEGEVPELVEMKAASDDSDANGEAEAEEEKAAKACADGKCGKCVECMSEKDADTTREQEVGEAAIKSADAVEVTEEVTPKNSETEKVSEKTSIEDVVEKAVKSAMESVKAEIESLRADKEAAVAKTISLETELATALTKAVAGGPKRTASATVAVSNEYLVKAITYKAKADATTDPVLAKGYRDLHDEFLAKANGTKSDK